MIAEENGIGFYCSQDIQSHDVFDHLLEKMGGADYMLISSFAITEAYIRRIIRNRDIIKNIELILDFTIATRNPRIVMYADHNVDGVFLANNHSKVIYVEKGGKSMVAVMSNNATNNYRFESGIIITDDLVARKFVEQINEMKGRSIRYGAGNDPTAD